MNLRVVLRVVITASLLMPASMAFAQATGAPNTRQPSGPPSPVVIGLEAGPMLSSLDSSNPIGTDTYRYDTRFLGGFFMDTRPSGRVSVILEALVGNKGSTKTNLPVHNIFWTIEIPVLARLYVNGGGTVRPYVVGGSAVDLFVKKKTYVGGTLQTFSTERGHDLALVGGAGVQIDRYRIEVRYTKGRQNIAAMGGFVEKTKTISVLFGVDFMK